MKSGGVGDFAVVPSLDSNGVITKKYLRSLEDAVRQRTPIAGANIDFKITDGGCLISVGGGTESGGGAGGAGGAGGGGGGFVEIKLTVCSNGTPATITVLGR